MRKIPLFQGAAATALIVFAGSSSAIAGEPLTLQPKTGDPLPGLTSAELERFFKGKDAFGHPFAADEGLGPIFNQNSCSSCHAEPVTGGGGSITVTRFGKWNGTFDPLEQHGGSLLKAEVITVPGEDTSICQMVVPRDANWTALRVTNSAFGLGLVEAIPDSDILANVPISGGKAHMVPQIEHPDFLNGTAPADRVGRMGWKAQLATVLSFSADASLQEQGLTSYLLPDPVLAPHLTPAEEAFCDQWGPAHPQDNTTLFDGVTFIDRVTDFQRFVSGPPQTPKSGMTGEQIFVDIGCAICHVPTWVTADDPSLEDALRNKEFRPYSDFLLHNMGVGADFIEQGDADAQEIRTPNLWGLRDRQQLLHNGSIAGGTFEARMVDVIAAHNVTGASSAARNSAQAFNALEVDDQTLMIEFLDSLGRAEFDTDGDRFISDDDFDALVDCYSGSADSYMPDGWGASEFPNSTYLDNGNLSPMDHPCAIFDIDQDGFIDETDFEMFLVAYQGNQSACDLWHQLQDNVAVNVDIPSECLCPGDLSGPAGVPDGVVDVFDIIALISDHFGPCPGGVSGCPGDLSGPAGVPDGTVDVFDIIALISDHFGTCP